MAATHGEDGKQDAYRQGQKAIEQGLRSIADIGTLFVTLPVTLAGQVTRGQWTTSAESERKMKHPRFKLPSPIEARSTSVDPLISLVEIFIRATETIGAAFGGRVNTPSFTGPRASDGPGAGRERRLTSPITTVVYLIRDIAETFQRGIQDGARRMRRRR